MNFRRKSILGMERMPFKGLKGADRGTPPQPYEFSQEDPWTGISKVLHAGSPVAGVGHGQPQRFAGQASKGV